MVDSFIVDIVKKPCCLDESDPPKFISIESLPDSNDANIHAAVFGHFQIRIQGLDLFNTSACQ